LNFLPEPHQHGPALQEPGGVVTSAGHEYVLRAAAYNPAPPVADALP
jgi:hypothetical protein